MVWQSQSRHDSSSSSSYPSSSSSRSDSEDTMEDFDEKLWYKRRFKNYAHKHGCVCLVEVDENGEEFILDQVEI